jgi:hypothetical protein
MSFPERDEIADEKEGKSASPVRGARISARELAGDNRMSSNSFTFFAGRDCAFRSSLFSCLRNWQHPWQAFLGTSFFSQKFFAMYDRLSENEMRRKQSPRQARVSEKRSNIVKMSLTGPEELERTGRKRLT